MGIRKVLFVSAHNSGRSQMAQAWLNSLCPRHFEALSAGITPAGQTNRLVIRAMQEAGIDISETRPRSVYDVYKSQEVFSYIITVCDQESAEKCPVFLGLIRQVHWSFPDPCALAGSDEELLRGIRTIRDAIREKVAAWCVEMSGADGDA